MLSGESDKNRQLTLKLLGYSEKMLYTSASSQSQTVCLIVEVTHGDQHSFSYNTIVFDLTFFFSRFYPFTDEILTFIIYISIAIFYACGKIYIRIIA